MISPIYFSFLIRIWKSSDPLQEAWFASLEDPATKTLTYFKTLDDLFEFLVNISIAEGQENNLPAEH